MREGWRPPTLMEKSDIRGVAGRQRAFPVFTRPGAQDRARLKSAATMLPALYLWHETLSLGMLAFSRRLPRLWSFFPAQQKDGGNQSFDK
ncbi:MAG: hypothetical protein LBF50_06995 [Azoarcus sp.]|jgi:hypothetical protein|nr:hypothetical protein [Azoarcus sp.]